MKTAPVFTADAPEVLFEGQFEQGLVLPYRNYDISLDGERFIMVKTPEVEFTSFNVVLNWFEELKKLVPTE